MKLPFRSALTTLSLLLGSAQAASIVFGLGGEPASLDPSVTADGNSAYVQTQIYNGLLAFKPGTIDVQPDLALRWQVSPDGLTWTFNLRQGVKFHDGTAFDAEAVRFNFLRWWDQDAPYGAKATGKVFLGWKNNLGGFKGEAGSILKDVRVVNRYTVALVLNQPYPALASVLADSGLFGIASPTAVKKNAKTYGTPAGDAVGTGPFTFDKWNSGMDVRLSRNDKYYRGAAKSEGLNVRFIKDPASRLNELRTGTVDISVDLQPDQLSAIKNDPKLNEALRPPLNVGYLALNTSYKPLSDVRVRTAIAMGLNRKEIVNAFWNGLGISDAHLIPPPMSRSYGKANTDYKFDPAAAKKLLAAAGYPNGFTLDLWYMPVSRPYFPNPKAIAEAMSADLSAIGVKVNLKTEDWAAYLQDRQAGKFQSFMLGMVYATDPDTAYTFLVGPGSTSDIDWSNAELNKALADSRKQTSDARRIPYYQKIDEIIFKEAVRIPIVHARLLAASTTAVRGWVPSPTGYEKLDTVSK